MHEGVQGRGGWRQWAEGAVGTEEEKRAHRAKGKREIAGLRAATRALIRQFRTDVEDETAFRKYLVSEKLGGEKRMTVMDRVDFDQVRAAAGVLRELRAAVRDLWEAPDQVDERRLRQAEERLELARKRAAPEGEGEIRVEILGGDGLCE